MAKSSKTAASVENDHELAGYKRKSFLLDEAEKIARMGTWDWNMESEQVRWSAVFYDIVQMSEQSIKPGLQTYMELLMPEDAETLRLGIILSIKTHKVFEHFHRIFLKDGSVKYIESRGNCLFDEQGKPIRMIGTILDVTERVEVQGQLEKAYRLVHSSINEIYMIDRDSYRFSFASEGACRNLGYSQKEITRLTPFDLCPMIPRMQVIEMMAPVMEHKQEQVVFEAMHLRKDGTTYPVEVRLQLMDKDGPPMFVAVAMDMTANKQVQQKLRDQAVLLRSVIDATRDLIFFKDKQGRYLGCNKAFEQLTGFDERELINQTDQSIFETARAEQFSCADKTVLSEGKDRQYQQWTTYPDGGKALFETTKTPYYNESGEIEGVVGVCTDATEHWYFERHLKSQAVFLQSIIDNINESVIVVGHDREIQMLNQTAGQFIEQGILLEPKNRHQQRDDQGHLMSCPLTEVLENKVHKTVVHNHTGKDGVVRHIELMVSPLFDEDGEVSAAIEIGRDITAHLQLQHQLERQKDAYEYSAHYDSLTNLPNRVLFHDRLTQSIAKAKRHKERLAVFFIDLDHFKPINDTYGHDVGDRVLQVAANRIKSSVREMDSVARLGGDEFTVILESIRQPQSASLIAHKIIRAMEPVVIVGDNQFSITASIGIALYPENGTTIDELVKHADEAMYRVKQESRDGYQFYCEHLSDKAFERALMENHLRLALQNNELNVCYQSLCDLSNGKVIGIEALSRWNSPQLGSIMPEKFIPLAEDVGLIQAIDEWVLENACRQMVQWKDKGLGEIRMSVNLSSAELNRKNFFEVVAGILDKTGCKPAWLELEITESCFLGNQENAATLLNELQGLGVGLVIDDFGTGYSSLGKLRELPISKLKIDHSFISNITNDESDASITRAVIGLAKTLGLKVVAEGVETEQQRQFLLGQHCDQAQGFLFSRPVSAEMMTEKLCLSQAS